MTARATETTKREGPEATAVSILGLPWDRSSSHLRGAARGPDRIRQAFRSPAGNPCSEDGTDLALEERLRDIGNLELEGTESDEGTSGAERMISKVETATLRILDEGARVLALGGDHSVSYPLLRAHGQRYKALWVVHFDAHPDLYDELDGDRLSHACPFARVMEEGLLRGLTQIGIRTATPHQRSQAERFGVDSYPPGTPATELWERVQGPVYISFDLDVLDPAFVPGVSHPEPGGLSVREAIDLLHDLPGPVVGADLVELNPRRDPAGLTALVAAKLMKELAARMLHDL